MRYKPGAHTGAWFFWANGGRSYRRGQPLDIRRILEGKKTLTSEDMQRMMNKIFAPPKPRGRVFG